ARIWQETKKTVVMITNDVDEAVLLADRIYALAPAAGGGAAVDPGMAVDIPRPRLRKELSLQTPYQDARRRLVEALTRHRRPVAPAAEPPQRPSAAAALSLEGGR
ncbi:MAG: hypothetical protein ACT4O3_03560, partial [Elusimicrobiota bacterium]